MQLRALARKLSTAADSLETAQRRQSGELAAARAWQGPSADRFRAEWASSHSRALTSAAEKLRAASSDVERNAREQEAASGADGSSVGGVGARPYGGGVNPAVTAGVGAGASVGFAALLLGVDKPDVLGSIAEAAGRYWPGVGRFAPRGADGRFIASGADRWRTALRAASDRNWVPSPHAKGISQALTKWGTRVAMVGAVVKFGVTAVEQWNEDGADPGMDPTLRGARAATKGAFSAAGTLGGSLAGAKIGALLGSFVPVPGVGTAAGAIIGGFVGGLVGSGVGDSVGDYLISDGFQSTAGNAVADAGRAVVSAAEAVAGAAQAVGRGLSEVGKALKFWG